MRMFQGMGVDGSGIIAFNEWLSFGYTYICTKAPTLNPTLSASFSIDRASDGGSGLVRFIKQAVGEG